MDLRPVLGDVVDILRRITVANRRCTDRPAFTRLRYLKRQLLKPPNIPATPRSGLTYRLYQLYGHQHDCMTTALQAHCVCTFLKMAVYLQKHLPLPWLLACYTTAVLTTMLSIVLLELLAVIVISVFIGLCYVMSFWSVENIFIEINFIMGLTDGIEEYRGCLTYAIMSYLGISSIEGFMDILYLAGIYSLIGLVVFCIFMLLMSSMDHICSLLSATLESLTSSGPICSVCMGRKVSQYFEPCGHLVCCVDCSQQLLRCPICKQNISREMRSGCPPSSGLCLLCKDQPVSRILLPCAHAVCCSKCAPYVDDCPLCWEEVIDDKTFYLP